MKKKNILEESIKKITNTSSSFLDLDDFDRRRVLNLVLKKDPAFKVIGYKWFDILTNKFFAIRYEPLEGTTYGISENKVVFDSFGEFFDFIDGNIYENCCLYGYSFSDDELKKYNIDLSKINFESFYEKNIDSFSFELLIHEKDNEIEESIKRNKKIIEWFDECKTISNFDDLKFYLKDFLEKFNFDNAQRIFFSIALRKYGESIKDAAIQFLCENGVRCGVDIEKIYLLFGEDAALKAIENYKENDISYNTKRKRIRYLKDIYTFLKNDYSKERIGRFDRDLQMYMVAERFTNKKSEKIIIADYFLTFFEFTDYLNGDLSNADLLFAPIKESDLDQFITSSKTKRPFSDKYEKYVIEKYYEKDNFFVKQTWYDKYNNRILEKINRFNYFFDFIHYLKNDLSNADLLFCDGVSNLKRIDNINFTDCKLRSEDEKKLGLNNKFDGNDELNFTEFLPSLKNEQNTQKEFLRIKEYDNGGGYISYISDIHLPHRFLANKCKTKNDIIFEIRKIANIVSEQSKGLCLIAGDIVNDFELYKLFLTEISNRKRNNAYFFVLGNHELWNWKGYTIDKIVSNYKSCFSQFKNKQMFLIQNNIFYADQEWKEIGEEELSAMTCDELRERTRKARVIVFGGIGFAGENQEFNANNGIYRDVLDRNTELVETKRFRKLYEKVVKSLKGKNVIIITHMPKSDWDDKNYEYENGFLYISGHNHRNYFYDDGLKRIYSDNQIGYYGKNLNLKYAPFSYGFDWFIDFKDGVHEINRIDYENFYRGFNEMVCFKRDYKKLYFLKRDGTYMFLLESAKGTLSILNGGSIRKAGNHTINYFYENMSNYANSIRLFLKGYNELQKNISKQIKDIGGEGYIHGCIVDIDFYNHLFINPLDGKITPYFAYSIDDKYVYDNLLSLLKDKCPKLYLECESRINKASDNKLNLIVTSTNVTTNRYHVIDTDMYRISRILKALQYTTKYKIIRLWNDTIALGASSENGKRIVQSLMLGDADTEEK